MVTKVFYVICIINLIFPAAHSDNVYVSNKKGTDKKGCGKEDEPCATISGAVQNAKDEYNQITIINEHKNYNGCPIYVHKPLAFKGFKGVPTLDCGGKDAFVFNLDTKPVNKTSKKESKKKVLVKLDVTNLRIQNAKMGFSFFKATKNVILHLENVTFLDNAADVSWDNSPLCQLIMTNVKATGRSGNGVELDGCEETKVTIEKTKFLGKYIKVVPTQKSTLLELNIKDTLFDMSNRPKPSHSPGESSTTLEDGLLSPLHIVTSPVKTTVNIERSTFSNHHGVKNGIINVSAFQQKKPVASKINLNFVKLFFANNSVLNGNGAAVSLNLVVELKKKVPDYILFDGCTFIGNSALSGGAIWLSKWVKKKVFLKGCNFTENSARDKELGGGGAIYALGGNIQMKKCIFDGNKAAKSGGTLQVVNEKVTTLRISDSVFRNAPRSWSSIEGGVMFIDGATMLLLGKVVFDLSSGNAGETMFLFEGRPTVLHMSNATTFVCPQGYNYDESRFTLRTKSDRRTNYPAYHIFAFSCKPCHDLFYSTTRGSRQVNGTESRGTCRACPYGASCNGTIRARANFWGMVKGDVVEMVPCPKGYCCKREPCESYDSCHSYRTGTLCGHCADGYTEGIGSTECFPSTECNSVVYLWPAFNVFVIFFILSFHQEIVKKFSKLFLWSKDEEDTTEYRASERNHNQGVVDEPEDSLLLGEDAEPRVLTLRLQQSPPGYTSIDRSEEYNNSGGYAKVVYYFYQAVLLIRLSSYVSSASTPNKIIDLLTPILNFQFTSIWNCGDNDMSPVKKVFLKNSVAYWVFALCLFAYLCYKLLRYYRKRHSYSAPIDSEPAFQARSFPVRLVGMVMHVILLSYVALTQFTVQLLHCVDVGDETVLYINGNVACYRSDQVVVWCFFFVSTAFFPFAVYYGRKLLMSERISWKEFIAACFFPLIFLVRWACKSWQGCESWPAIQDGGGGKDHYKEKILYILQYPYKSPVGQAPSLVERYSEDWESVLMLRRLILVVVFIFVQSFLLRAYLFFILSVLFLLVHVFVQPYVNDNVNKLDNVALSLIVLIAGLSISEATYNNAGQLVPFSVKTLQILQDWFLAFLPFCLLGIFLYPRAKHHFLRCIHRTQTRAPPTDGVDTVEFNPAQAIPNGQVLNEMTPLA